MNKTKTKLSKFLVFIILLTNLMNVSIVQATPESDLVDLESSIKIAESNYDKVSKQLLGANSEYNVQPLYLNVCFLEYRALIAEWTVKNSSDASRNVYVDKAVKKWAEHKDTIFSEGSSIADLFLSKDKRFNLDGLPETSGLADAVINELEAQYTRVLNELDGIDADADPKAYTSYLENHKDTLGMLIDLGTETLRICTQMSPKVIGDTKNRIDDFKDSMDLYDVLITKVASELGIDLKSKFSGIDELDDKSISEFEQLVRDKDNPDNLNAFMISMIANSATYTPLITNIYSAENYVWLDETRRTYNEKYGGYRKLVYAPSSKTPAKDALQGDKVAVLKPITLKQFLDDFQKEQRALYIKKGETNTEDTLKAEKKEESATDEATSEKELDEKGVFPYPVYASGNLTQRMYLSKSRYVEDKDTYIKACRLNTFLLSNAIAQLGTTSLNTTGDLNHYLYIDIYGNIVTQSGVVVVPAISNATLYAKDKAMLPANASLKEYYPDVRGLSNGLRGLNSTDEKKQILMIANSKKAGESMSAKTLKKQNKISAFDDILEYTFPLVETLKLPSGELKFYEPNKCPTLKSMMSIFGLEMYSYESGKIVEFNDIRYQVDGVETTIRSVNASPNSKKAIYNMNTFYLLQDGKGAMGKKSNDTLRDDMMISLALEVAKGTSDVIALASTEPFDYEQAIADQKGFGARYTATQAGKGEAQHISLMNSNTYNNIVYTPKIEQMPLMDKVMVIFNLVLRLVLVTMLVVLIANLVNKKCTIGYIVRKILLSGLIIVMVSFLFPLGVQFFFNNTSKGILKHQLTSQTLDQLENSEKNLSQTHFSSFIDKEEIQNISSQIKLGVLTQDQYNNLADLTGDVELRNPLYKQFITGKYALNSKVITSSGTTLRDKLVLVDTNDLFKSSAIIDETKTEDIFSASIKQPILAQEFYKKTDLSYFMPYYLFIDNLIYNMNKTASITAYTPSKLLYDNDFKSVGFTQNYFRSYIFSEGNSYFTGRYNYLEDEKLRERVVLKCKEMGDLDDVLGILKFSGLPFIGEQSPFTAKEYKEDAVAKSSYYNNTYAINARSEYAKYVGLGYNMIMNGAYAKATLPPIYKNNTLYIAPEWIDTNTGLTYHNTKGEIRLAYGGKEIITKVDSPTYTYLGEDYKTASPVKNINGNVYVPCKLLQEVFSARYYYDNKSKVAIVNMPKTRYYNDLGEFFEKVYKTNNKFKARVYSYDSVMDVTSDENLIKVLALEASLIYNKQFSSTTNKLYPQTIEVDKLNLDLFLKNMFVPKFDISSNKGYSLFYYTAYTTDGFGVLLLRLYEGLLVLKGILQSVLLMLIQIIIPVLFIINYIAYDNYYNKHLVGMLLTYTFASLGHILWLMVALGCNMYINGDTPHFMNPTLFTIIVSILAVLANIMLLCWLFYVIFKDIYNMGGEMLLDTLNAIKTNVVSFGSSKLKMHPKSRLSRMVNSTKSNVNKQFDMLKPAVALSSAYMSMLNNDDTVGVVDDAQAFSVPNIASVEPTDDIKVQKDNAKYKTNISAGSGISSANAPVGFAIPLNGNMELGNDIIDSIGGSILNGSIVHPNRDRLERAYNGLANKHGIDKLASTLATVGLAGGLLASMLEGGILKRNDYEKLKRQYNLNDKDFIVDDDYVLDMSNKLNSNSKGGFYAFAPSDLGYARDILDNNKINYKENDGVLSFISDEQMKGLIEQQLDEGVKVDFVQSAYLSNPEDIRTVKPLLKDYRIGEDYEYDKNRNLSFINGNALETIRTKLPNLQYNPCTLVRGAESAVNTFSGLYNYTNRLNNENLQLYDDEIKRAESLYNFNNGKTNGILVTGDNRLSTNNTGFVKSQLDSMGVSYKNSKNTFNLDTKDLTETMEVANKLRGNSNFTLSKDGDEFSIKPTDKFSENLNELKAMEHSTLGAKLNTDNDCPSLNIDFGNNVATGLMQDIMMDTVDKCSVQANVDVAPSIKDTNLSINFRDNNDSAVFKKYYGEATSKLMNTINVSPISDTDNVLVYRIQNNQLVSSVVNMNSTEYKNLIVKPNVCMRKEYKPTNTIKDNTVIKDVLSS